MSLATLSVLFLLAACSKRPAVSSSDEPSGPSSAAPASASIQVGSAGVFPRQVSVNGHSLFIDCEGEGSPTVILEAGLWVHASNWHDVADTIASQTRVCRYSRVGMGASERVKDLAPRSVGDIANELHDLLGAAGIDGPYVVAGHSFGGLIVRAFRDAYPAEVVGMALIESTSERFIGPPWSNGIRWNERGPIKMVESEREMTEAAPFGSLPLIVLSAGAGSSNTYSFDARIWTAWSHWQNRLAELSNDSIHVIAERSGHFIQTSQPRIVVAALNELVEAARTGEPLPPCGANFERIGGRCVAN